MIVTAAKTLRQELCKAIGDSRRHAMAFAIPVGSFATQRTLHVSDHPFSLHGHVRIEGRWCTGIPHIGCFMTENPANFGASDFQTRFAAAQIGKSLRKWWGNPDITLNYSHWLLNCTPWMAWTPVPPAPKLFGDIWKYELQTWIMLSHTNYQTHSGLVAFMTGYQKSHATNLDKLWP